LYARNDAAVVKEYLIRVLGYREANIIYKEDATKLDFDQIFGISGNHHGELDDHIRPGRSDVFIYYSGHGAPDLNTMKAYFIPSDCKPGKIELTGYPLELFYENVSKLPARSVTIVMDACFSGGTSTGSNLIGSASPVGLKIVNPVIAKGNTVCITSSRGDQVSSWYDEKHHGLFTYLFLKTIRESLEKDNKSGLTYQELYDSLTDSADGVTFWAKYLHNGRYQTPTIQGTDLSRFFIRK
jgi:hypothetical protein